MVAFSTEALRSGWSCVMLCPSPTVVVQAIRTRVKDAAMPIVAVRFRLPIMNWELKVLDSVRGDGRQLR